MNQSEIYALAEQLKEIAEKLSANPQTASIGIGIRITAEQLLVPVTVEHRCGDDCTH